jgi:tetratricopeptide (TPR) repeat protein
VRVSPELVQVANVTAPTTIWQQTFDTLVADLPALQSSIASQVAHALSLETNASGSLPAVPNIRRNPLAYEAYLRGQQILRQGASGPADLQRAIGYFERAVSLDSSFAAGWAKLGWAKAQLWQNGAQTNAQLLDQVKNAAEHALQLGGAEADVRQVLAFYQLLLGNRGAAMQETELGLRADPSNARLVGYMASFLELDGRWTDALGYRRKAVALDPAAAGHAAGLATNLLWLRRLDEAQQSRLLQLRPSAFYGDTVWWQIARAQVYWLEGDSSRSRSYAEAGRKAASASTGRNDTNASEFSRLGLANALAGKADEAVQAGETSVALLPLAKDAMIGAQMVYRLACIESLVGRRDEAITTLQTLLSVPFYVSPAWLALDPNFVGLRGDQRLQRLVHPLQGPAQ